MVNSLTRRSGVRIVTLAALAAAVTYFVALALPKQYRSSATYYFPMSGLTPVGITGLPTQGQPEPTGSVRSLGGALVSPVVGSAPITAANLLDSFECRRAVVKQLGLQEEWGLSEIEAAESLRFATTVRTDQPGFLRLEVTNKDASLAQKIAQSYLEQLDILSKKLSLNVSRRNRDFVEAQVKAAREQVRILDAELVAVLADGSVSDPSKLVSEYLGAKSRLRDAEVLSNSLNAKLTATRNSLIQLYSEGGAFPTVSLLLPNLSEQIDERRLKLSDAKTNFQPGTPEVEQAMIDVRAVESLGAGIVNERKSAISKGYDPAIASLTAEKLAADSAAAEIRRQIASLQAEMELTPVSFVRLERTRRELRIAEQNLESLEAEYQTALIAESRDPARFEVLDRPFVDDRPVAPRKVLLAGSAFVIALGLQVLLLLVGKVREVSPEPLPPRTDD